MSIAVSTHTGRYLMRSVHCLITLFLIASYAVNALANQCFDDEHLGQLLISSQKRGVLVYVWSPRMVYSLHNMATAAHAASDAGLEVVVLHDRRVPDIELHTTRVSSQALCSVQLFEREALRHFPTAFVISAGSIHPHPIVGAMPASSWHLSLQLRLSQPMEQP